MTVCEYSRACRSRDVLHMHVGGETAGVRLGGCSTTSGFYYQHSYQQRLLVDHGKRSAVNIGVGAQSTWGARHFCPQKYMYEKLAKCPNYTWYLPENARISHDICPQKIFSWFFGGSEGWDKYPLSSDPLRLLRLWLSVFSQPFTSHLPLFQAATHRHCKLDYCNSLHYASFKASLSCFCFNTWNSELDARRRVLYASALLSAASSIFYFTVTWNLDLLTLKIWRISSLSQNASVL